MRVMCASLLLTDKLLLVLRVLLLLWVLVPELCLKVLLLSPGNPYHARDLHSSFKSNSGEDDDGEAEW